ncbi:ABC transporter [Microbacterium sp. ru370.1]|uniref:ATP-binding cassette domain-containing protein n=1 Tax=unclassified Microbacterium TaxID=2609290 RepID=UPI00088415CA|nr:MULTISPECIES: ATP-binding cassette domain-containing protein [unclassified Microbacterium]SDO77847.1 ABC transporter [Microbacterium sp. ru370.1]SIT88983.1 peptide/nickel transport system ATP-binding protein [Microbacterium sp. RU1D]
MARSLDTDVALRTDDLSLARNGVRVIDGITVTLAAGGTLVVRGATGAGKTSLVSLLAGHPDDGLTVVGGDARIHGISARRPGRARREWVFHTGYLPQGAGAGLPSRLTVQDVIAEPITSRDRRVNTRALAVRVATLLDEMELPLGTAPKYPYELSAGMRQRVALARALVLEPRLFVADDLYANLDVEVRAAARASITRRRDERGMASLIVTNDADAPRDLDADVLVLHAGHAVALGHGDRTLQWTPDGTPERRISAR